VRLRCHLDEGLAHAKTGSHREVRRRNVEIDEEIVPEESERLAVRDELCDIAPYDRELSFGIARRRMMRSRVPESVGLAGSARRPTSSSASGR
jgi:hypothetical protein